MPFFMIPILAALFNSIAIPSVVGYVDVKNRERTKEWKKINEENKRKKKEEEKKEKEEKKKKKEEVKKKKEEERKKKQEDKKKKEKEEKEKKENEEVMKKEDQKDDAKGVKKDDPKIENKEEKKDAVDDTDSESESESESEDEDTLKPKTKNKKKNKKDKDQLTTLRRRDINTPKVKHMRFNPLLRPPPTKQNQPKTRDQQTLNLVVPNTPNIPEPLALQSPSHTQTIYTERTFLKHTLPKGYSPTESPHLLHSSICVVVLVVLAVVLWTASRLSEPLRARCARRTSRRGDDVKKREFEDVDVEMDDVEALAGLLVDIQDGVDEFVERNW